MLRCVPVLKLCLIIALLATPAAAKKGLGEWYKNADLDFKVRVPDDWTEIAYKKAPPNVVGHWIGSPKQVNIKKLGTFPFRGQARILWFSTLDDSHPSTGEAEELTEEQVKALAGLRATRSAARNLEQWVHNFSGFMGVRFLDRKETKVDKRPATEYEFLSKTNVSLEFKHYAVAVKVSEAYEVVLLYSIIEPEYREWKSLFRKCVRTLQLDWPEYEPPKATNPRKTELEAPGADAFSDILITHHGKVVEGQIREEGESYFIAWDDAEIEVPASLVMKVEYGDPQRYVPETDEEKEKLAEGYVRFKGRWVSEHRYAIELKREQEKKARMIEELKKHSDFSNPWTVKTSRFVMESTTSRELMEHYVALLNALFSAYEKCFGISVSRNAKKNRPTVRIFKDREEYVNYSKKPGTGGYFHWVDNSLNLFHNFEDPSLTEGVLLHEGTHLLNFLSNTSFPARPHWVEEGAAEYFGSSLWTRKGKEIKLEPGQIQGNRLLLVNQRIITGEVADLRAALATNSYKYEDYAYWWSTFHFFMTHKKYGPRFKSFFRNLYALKKVKKHGVGSGIFGVSPENAVQFLESSLGIRDWRALQDEWQDFVMSSVDEVGGYGWMVLGRDLFRESQRLKKKKKSDLDEEEKKEMVRHLLEQSLETLNKTIVDLEYLKADAFYYRSEVQRALKNRQEALDDIAQAIRLDPLKSSYYFKRATLLYGEKNVEGAKHDMRIAMALDPLDITLPAVLKEMKEGSYKTPDP